MKIACLTHLNEMNQGVRETVEKRPTYHIFHAQIVLVFSIYKRKDFLRSQKQTKRQGVRGLH